MVDMRIFGRVLRDSTPRFVGPSVRLLVLRSVRHTLLIFGFGEEEEEEEEEKEKYNTRSKN